MIAPGEILRHLRRVVPGWYSTFFRIFWGSKIPEIFAFFCTFLGPQKLAFFGVRTNFWTFWPNPPKPRFWQIFGFLARYVGLYPKCQKVPLFRILAKMSISAILSIFVDFCRFPEISKNRYFRSFSGHVRKCPKVAILDTSNCSTLRSQKSQLSAHFWTPVSRSHHVSSERMCGFLYVLFF